MDSKELLLDGINCILKFLFFFFVLLPYFYFEALINKFTKKVPKSVKGEIVLITGTGHGIGKLLAKKYAKEGATVVCWDMNEELNNKTIEEIKQLGYPNVYGYKVDVSNRENVMQTAQKVRDQVGDVTILINNAGVMPHHSFLDHTEQEIRKIMDVNIMGNFWTIQAFLPAMKKNNKGHIVALSSMAGRLGLINLVPYNASKFAVRGLMEGLQEEFRRIPNNHVHFTTIYPYMVDTGLCKNVEITHPSLTSMLKPEYVCEEVFLAQTLNKTHVRLDKLVEILGSLKEMYIPTRAGDYLSDNFKTDLLSDLETDKNGLETNKTK
ncbi:short-chain dehydrogenase/reductase family 16C member 6-like [Anthonomus grandis grandis]|uniref:short-chain dehydrogenase/reductase family 16C member 6-like n=1 Tax=Anthonomus grandis grandis TaxID=2921223 RepID=UPI0021654DC3|nr:short-chain dehydrogenase/reductase family 16C member 6-like [Anthonomus grandis grandis]